MEFNRTTCGVVERDILAALKEVESKHGIKFAREGGGRYTDSTFTLKLKASVVGDDGENLAERREFERAAEMFGFKPEHYGKQFTSKGELYRIIGFNFRARRMPIQAVRVSDGAGFKFADPTGNIKKQLNAA